MHPARLSDADALSGDNILPLRHLAALLVIYGHSYALAFNPAGEADVFAHLLPGFYAGNLAVHLFFAISGYLVTSSLLRHPGVLRYMRNRALRVYPAYIVCVLLCVFALGPVFTTLSAREYLVDPGTWTHLQQNLIPITFAWTLPGVFAANPVADVVNGTLWSLGLEVRWYAYLGVLAAFTLVRRRWAFTLVALAVLGLGVWEWWSGKPDPLEYRALSQMFLLAALAAHWRSKIRVAHWMLAACMLAMVLAHGTRWFGASVMLTAMYFCVWFAYRLPRLPWPQGLDLSYGLFLYGYPVQQMLMARFPSLGPWSLCIAATLCTLPLATASWFLIERPALRWKARGRPLREMQPAP